MIMFPEFITPLLMSNPVRRRPASRIPKPIRGIEWIFYFENKFTKALERFNNPGHSSPWVLQKRCTNDNSEWLFERDAREFCGSAVSLRVWRPQETPSFARMKKKEIRAEAEPPFIMASATTGCCQSVRLTLYRHTLVGSGWISVCARWNEFHSHIHLKIRLIFWLGC